MCSRTCPSWPCTWATCRSPPRSTTCASFRLWPPLPASTSRGVSATLSRRRGHEATSSHATRPMSRPVLPGIPPGAPRPEIHSYRDSLVLFLHFAARDAGRPIEVLEIADVTADRVGRFLTFLEADRHNGIATRNTRLAALHTFVRFVIADHPEHIEALQHVLGIPFKR